MYIKTANFTLLATSLWTPIEALAKLSKTDGYECILIKENENSGAILEFYSKNIAANSKSTILQTLLSFREQSIARVTVFKGERVS
tara:strand:+ start:268 stop:525 length:258 start_codon:yes stop_codon:yes gene_type:complete